MNYAGTNDKLDLLISLAALGCSDDDIKAFDNLDDSNVVLSKEFNKKKAQIIKKYNAQSFNVGIKKFSIRLLVAVLIIMSLSLITIMAVGPVREALFEAIVEWYDDYITIRFERVDGSESVTSAESEADTDSVSGSNAEAESESESAADIITPPTKIEVYRKPSYIPDGVIEDVVLQTPSVLSVDFYFENELSYTFYQLVLDESNSYVDSEAAVIGTTSINGNIAQIVEYAENGKKLLIWSDEEYIYQIFSLTYSVDEMITIAKSVN